MTRSITSTLAACCILVSVAVSAHENDFTVIHDKKTNDTIFVFKVDRGDVRFNHDMHQRKMRTESCIPCHRTSSPTPDSTLTRLDYRQAHIFCKGCHKKNGKGPIECHECHRVKR